MAINTLPSELIIEILERCASISIKTLLSASQISRSFQSNYKTPGLQSRLLERAAHLHIPKRLLLTALAIGNFHAPINDSLLATSEAVTKAQGHVDNLIQGRVPGAYLEAMKAHFALALIARECMHYFRTDEDMLLGFEEEEVKNLKRQDSQKLHYTLLKCAYDYAGITSYQIWSDWTHRHSEVFDCRQMGEFTMQRLFVSFLRLRLRRSLRNLEDEFEDRINRLISYYWTCTFDCKAAIAKPQSYTWLSEYYDPENESKLTALFFYLGRCMFPAAGWRRMQGNPWEFGRKGEGFEGVPSWRSFHALLEKKSENERTRFAFEWFEAEEAHHVYRIAKFFENQGFREDMKNIYEDSKEEITE